MLRKLIIALIIIKLIFLQTGTVSAEPGLVADYLYEIAVKCYKNGGLGGALEAVEKILLIEPFNKNALKLKGDISSGQAKAVFAKSGLVAGYLYEIAVKCYKEGDLRGALEAIKKILLIEPANKNAVELKEDINRRQLKIGEIKRVGFCKASLVKKKKAVLPDKILRAKTCSFLGPDIGRPRSTRVLKGAVLKKVTSSGKMSQLKKEEAAVLLPILQKEPIIPRPGAVSDRFITPEETVTSKELKDYCLFNEVKLFVNGDPIEIIPIIIKDGDIRIPLEKLAKALGIVAFFSKKDTLTIIDSRGLPLEFMVGKKEVFLNRQEFAFLNCPILKYEGWIMLALEDADKALGLAINWDKDNKTIKLANPPASKEFTTFIDSKPKEQKIKETETVSQKQPIQDKPALRPFRPQADIKLEVNNNTTFLYNNLTEKILKTEQLNILGKAYDYKFQSQFRWKERGNNDFLNENKYIRFFKKDLSLEFLNLSAAVPYLRSQSESFEGARFDVSYNPFSTRVYTGQRHIAVNGPAAVGQISYNGNILGVEQKYTSEALDVTQAIIAVDAQAEAEEKSGVSAFPVKNLVSVTGVALKLPYQIGLSGQFGLCNYYSDNNRDDLIQDNNYRIETKVGGEKLSWRWSYEFVADNYASLGNPLIYQDYKGWNLSGRYKLNELVSFSESYSQSQDNVDKIETSPTNKNKNLSLGANLSPAANTNFGFSWLKGENQTQDPSSGVSRSISYNYLFHLSQNYKNWMLLFAYDHYNLKTQRDLFSDTGSFSLFKFIPESRGSYLRARQQIKRTGYKESDASAQTNYSNDFGFKYYFKRNFSMYGNLIINNIRSEGQASDPLSFNSGMQWDINRGLGFGLDFNFSPYDLSNEQSRNSRAWSVLLKFFNRFEVDNFSWGRIKGRVFRDLNENGVYDDTELGLCGVTITVHGESNTKTNKNGCYVFKEIIPGAKIIRVEIRDLPIELILPKGEAVDAVIEPGKTTKIDFPLLETSSIKGRVFLDENANGVYDIGEEGIEGINIYLSPQIRTAKSDENGKFSFEFLPPGDYEISMDSDQLPMEYKLAFAEKFKIKLTGGRAVLDANFCATFKPVAVKKF